jgi:hypothetical protein
MTHIVEHKSLRYTWELVRHTYLLDLESEIEIRQVEISPLQENRVLDPPYPFTPFFEIEIDQIQKNGKTVFSFRNICPVEINEKPDWNFLNSLVKTGGPQVTKRHQSQEGENETRWLYSDDFFLISLSSGDRHDLSMLLSLIIGKLNMIALSIQSGRRIRSEFENQQKYRAAMSTMFSEGVDGAFRDVPVYRQHGDMTDSKIDVSAALMSTELQDLTAACASEDGTEAKIPVAGSAHIGSGAQGNDPAESASTESTDAEPATCVSIPEVNPSEFVTGLSSLTGIIPEDSTHTDNSAKRTILAETISEDRSQKPIISEEKTWIKVIPKGKCSSCCAQISNTAKFCGNCGTAVSTAPPAEKAPGQNAPADYAPASSGTPDSMDAWKASSGSRPEAKLAIDVKTVEELQDLSWLSD